MRIVRNEIIKKICEGNEKEKNVWKKWFVRKSLYVKWKRDSEILSVRGIEWWFDKTLTKFNKNVHKTIEKNTS